MQHTKKPSNLIPRTLRLSTTTAASFAKAQTASAPITQKEYEQYFAEKIEPLFKEAAEILEQAYAIDQDNGDILKYLENVYYNLHDEAKLNDVKKRMTYQ